MQKHVEELHEKNLNYPASKCAGVTCRNDEVTMSEILYMVRRKAYFGEKDDDGNIAAFEKLGYIRNDLGPSKDQKTFSINALYSALYGLNLIKSADVMLEGDNYPYFEHLPEERVEKVEKVLNRLKHFNYFGYNIVVYRFGFSDGRYWSYEEIAEKLCRSVEEIKETEKAALQRMKEDGYGRLPRMIGVVLG